MRKNTMGVQNLSRRITKRSILKKKIKKIKKIPNFFRINMDNPRTDYGAGYAKDKYEKVYYEKKKYPEYDEKPEKKKKPKKPKTYGGPKQVFFFKKKQILFLLKFKLF